MARFWRLPAIVTNILALIGLAAIWIAFAPTNLGGQVSYAMVNGISMEPNFHTGDLVIARRSPSYQVGEIVIYRDALMNDNVVHRIISTAQDRFILQGDNNTWVDEYEPTQAEVVGKLWIHLPKAGAAVKWLQLPLNMAIVAGLLGILFMVSITMEKPNKVNQKKKPSGNPAGMFEIGLYLSGMLAVIFLGLAIFAFSRPLERAADDIQYQQSGAFFYSAATTPGVYDTDSLQSGDPIFTNLTCSFNLGFIYTLQGGDQLENISGQQEVYASIQDPQSGWKRTIPLSVEESFSGNTHTSLATLDLCQVQTLVASVETETGLHIGSYTLSVVAHDAITGSALGQVFSDSFEPHLNFKVDSLHLSVAGDSSQANPLQTVQSGSISNPDLVSNTFQLLGLSLPIRATRIFAILGLVISLGGLLTLGYIFYKASREDPQAVVRIKYSSLLIDVYDSGLKALSPVINVATINDLARLAERQNVTIMHLSDDHAHYYFVQIEGMTYRLVTGKRRMAS